ncbi:DUF7553 family protein [Halapricum salinum]|uniref:Pterin-binding domain-containing protein n=1 Tax=Halapricum salinum TaxID=1457250 RepID=A0A4D6HBR8_9EURY|nr:hypothetical protein [Halapricum salinum]QCC50961.1 hypothetical protein DV733_06745 [Halapricum salinum]
MTRDELANASDLLESAAETTSGDAADRLTEIASQIERLATADRGPDHGRLARWQNALGEVKADVDEATGETIEEALDAIVAYRSTVDGV